MNGLAGELHAQSVHQVKGLNSVVESRRPVIGGTRSVGQGTWVDSGDWAILIMDIGGKFGILGMLAVSTHLLAAMMVAATLSLGRSISTATSIGSTLLLLLLGKLLVHLLVLHSTRLVGLRGLAATAARGTLLLEQESGCLDNAIRLQDPDLAR